MKAAIMEGKGKLIIREVPRPVCAMDEVLVKVAACGICRTDMKCLDHGQRDLRLPRILGHEIAGTVAEIGREVSGWQLADRVQVAPGLGCGQCSFCRRGLDHLCEAMEIIGFHQDGGFAEYLRIPSKGLKNGVLNSIPPAISFAEAALTEPLACSVNMQDSLRVGPGDRVLIFGAGPLGILNAKLARVNGAGTIILIEADEQRRKRAEKYDFDLCLDPGSPAQMKAASDGDGADVVIPCCPGLEAVQQGLQILNKRGRFGFFSGLLADSQGIVDFNLIHYKEIMAYGAYGCSTAHNRQALAYISSGKVQVKEMITRQIGLDELSVGLDLVRTKAETSIMVVY